MDRNNQFYREIESCNPVSKAEATIAWFFSGKKQRLINVITRYPVYADGVYDCTQKMQAAIDNSGICILPKGDLKISQRLVMPVDVVIY